MLTIILVILPLLFALPLFAIREEKVVKWFALLASVVEFGIAVAAFIQYKTSCHCQLLFSAGWIGTEGITLKFGMDGITLLLVMLTTLLTPVIIFSSFGHTYKRPSAFYGLILIMEMALVGVFTSLDGLIFYIFWELALIPAYFICAYWGGKDRIKITFKFFIYTFTGSLFMLVALIYVYFRTPLPHSFDLFYLYNASLTPGEQSWIFAALFLAFAIKIPIFPLHTWQPDTYTESPGPGTMLLSGIMLKMGLYGVIRLMIPLCGAALREFGYLAAILAIAGLVYASVIAIRQDDMKRLVAYSSLAHAGLMAAGLFILNIRAIEGVVIQMISHGVNIVGLFIIIEFIQDRLNTRKISELSGIATKAPKLAVLFMIILLGSIALPMTNGFIGEFLILLGIFEYNALLAAVAGLTIIFSAVYMLWMYQRTMLGSTNQVTNSMTDLTVPEMITLLPVIIIIFWIGIFPGMFLDLVSKDILQILSYLR
ncbi:MAG: NADH-quinone oxidoreductase subunit M [bacterium]